MTLTHAAISAAKPSGKPRKLADEKGLFLLISPAGGKWWRWKYRFGGKEKLLSFGTYPEVGLKEARNYRDEARKLLAAGTDPGEARKAIKRANEDAGANRLELLMSESHEFKGYFISDLMQDEKVATLLENFGETSLISEELLGKISIARLFVSRVIPSIDEVFRDIRERAEEIRDQPVLVGKPNSPNAHIHYFVRHLSGYCRAAFGQPLHEVVATTTSVIFDLPNCDDDYVRKLVNS